MDMENGQSVDSYFHSSVQQIESKIENINIWGVSYSEDSSFDRLFDR